MSESIESPLIRVPLSSLRRTTRERKYALDAIEAALRRLQAEEGAARSREEHLALLDNVAQELEGWQQKLEATGAAEAADLQRCRARLAHLAELGPAPKDGALDWSRRRLDRILVDHLLRTGNYDSALQLASESGIQELTDVHIFAEARGVVEALHARDCGPALAWCDANKPKLKKIRSSLEFQLRVQEFVELVRAGDLGVAIRYARAHLAQWAEAYEAEHQRACALLAFSGATGCSRYAGLLDDRRWAALVRLFHGDLFRLHNMPPVSLLNVHLQAGLAALKTTQSLTDDGNTEDPLHLPSFRALAQPLPYAKHVHSKLVCSITREMMNEDNPPLVTPDGNVYSEKGIKANAAQHGGVFVCPSTGERYDPGEMKRCYIS